MVGSGKGLRVAPSPQGAADGALLMAQEAGLFAKYGVNVEVVHAPGNTFRLAQMVAQGELDLATMPAAPMVRLNMEGAGLVMILGLVGRQTTEVVAARQIKDPSQLKGTTMGVTGFGDADHVVLRSALEGWSLEPGKDVTLKEFGSRPAVFAAFLGGEIVGFAVTPPGTYNAVALGHNLLTANAEKEIDYQLGAVVAKKSFLSSHRKEAKGYVKGHAEGIKLFKEDKEWAIRVLGAWPKSPCI